MSNFTNLRDIARNQINSLIEDFTGAAKTSALSALSQLDNEDYSGSASTLTTLQATFAGGTNPNTRCGNAVTAVNNAKNAQASGSSGVGGSNTQVQYNDAGASAGDSGLTWDKTNKILRVNMAEDATFGPRFYLKELTSGKEGGISMVHPPTNPNGSNPEWAVAHFGPNSGVGVGGVYSIDGVAASGLTIENCWLNAVGGHLQHEFHWQDEGSHRFISGTVDTTTWECSFGTSGNFIVGGGVLNPPLKPLVGQDVLWVLSSGSAIETCLFQNRHATSHAIALILGGTGQGHGSLTGGWYLMNDFGQNGTEHFCLFNGWLGGPTLPIYVNKASNAKVGIAHAYGDTLNYNLDVAGTIGCSGNAQISGNAILSIGTGVPASAGAVGVAGTVAVDTGFIYVCTATNTWKRAAIATW